MSASAPDDPSAFVQVIAFVASCIAAAVAAVLGLRKKTAAPNGDDADAGNGFREKYEREREQRLTLERHTADEKLRQDFAATIGETREGIHRRINEMESGMRLFLSGMKDEIHAIKTDVEVLKQQPPRRR